MRYPEIVSQYVFPEILFLREKISNALSKIVDPYIVSFSCNVWNMEYNKALAQRVKEKYPECIIIFGGHSIGTDDSLLKREDYIDILVHGEGEIVFADLLLNLSQGRLEDVKSISYRDNNGIKTTPRGCICDLSELPSPYLTGVFDSILEKYKEFQLDVVLETNRGCTYCCAYCDWTHGKKMRFFPMEKIKAEILWIAENKLPFIFCGDSNFGLYNRDLEIIDFLIETKRKYGYPEAFRVNYEKNSTDRVFQICQKLNQYGMDKGATISYQSLCPEALKNIGRKNLTLDHFSELMRRYTEAGIPTYSELILGLPGETYESFCKGMCTLLENGQHSSIYVFLCEILPNAPMASPEYMKKYQIEITKIDYIIYHGKADDEEEIKECSEIIRSTYSMDKDAWVATNLFSICVQAFHSIPMIRFFALYLYEEKISSYFDFYSGFSEFLLQSNDQLGDVWRNIKQKHDDSLKDGKFYSNPRIGNINWAFEEGVFLEAVFDTDATLKEIMPYLKSFNIPEDVFDDLLKYQTSMLRKPFDKKHSANLKYDFPTYFSNIYSKDYQPLQKRKTKLEITPNRSFDDFETYAREIVWYGRRRELSVYKKDEINITYE